VAALQLLTIVLSRGNVYLLGEAYAFGVLWSFVLKSLGVLVLRFTRPGPREFRVPLNLRIRGMEIPVGLSLITLTLLSIAITNLFTKPVATTSGVAFALFLFTVFTVSERMSSGPVLQHGNLDPFQLRYPSTLSPESVGCRPGAVLVCVSNHHVLWHLAAALREVSIVQQDVVVLHIRVLKRAVSGEHELSHDQLFATSEQMLFTKVVMLAEKEGKPVRLAIIAANNVWDCMVRAAADLQCQTIALAESSKMSLEQQARRLRMAWQELAERRQPIGLEIYARSGKKHFFYLGPEAPQLSPNELALMHNLHLQLNSGLGGHDLRHHEVVYFALQEVQRELGQTDAKGVLQRLKACLSEHRVYRNR
jgi:hypothetical protein